jgi:hypothetical protein
MGRFEQAVAAIDAANADDPHTIVIDGVVRPKEQAHAELMTEWVSRLDPDADEAQLLAARAHHLRRWSIPRESYAPGRSGYLKWRTALRRQHADEVVGILSSAGYGEDTIDRVQRIIRKQGLGSDPVVQVHEDALCIVFLVTQLEELAAKLDDDDKVVDVLRKTAAKMTPAALTVASTLPLSEGSRALLTRALS